MAQLVLTEFKQISCQIIFSFRAISNHLFVKKVSWKAFQDRKLRNSHQETSCCSQNRKKFEKNLSLLFWFSTDFDWKCQVLILILTIPTILVTVRKYLNFSISFMYEICLLFKILAGADTVELLAALEQFLQITILTPIATQSRQRFTNQQIPKIP